MNVKTHSQERLTDSTKTLKLNLDFFNTNKNFCLNTDRNSMKFINFTRNKNEDKIVHMNQMSIKNKLLGEKIDNCMKIVKKNDIFKNLNKNNLMIRGNSTKIVRNDIHTKGGIK